jgi:hypothetical protein
MQAEILGCVVYVTYTYVYELLKPYCTTVEVEAFGSWHSLSIVIIDHKNEYYYYVHTKSWLAE